MGTAFATTQGILFNYPLAVIWLAGIGMAWMHREMYPRLAVTVILALALLFSDLALSIYFRLWLPVAMEQYNSSLLLFLDVLHRSGALSFLLQMTGWSLLLFAVFNWRQS